MPTTLTAAQIVALAPDAASATAGRALASLHKWQNLGQNDVAAWGECQGSGKAPYRVQVDLREPAFRCTCPSRKFPCKHGIGLLLLVAAHPAAFTAGAPPAWVAEWLATRDQNAQRRAAPAAGAGAEAPPVVPKRSGLPGSAAAREARVADGLEELDRWLCDLVRQGLAPLQGRGHRFWDDMARRMIDAQAPGVARMIRDLPQIVASGEGWQSRLLERLARIHLLIAGYRRRSMVSPDVLAEVRSRLGWAQDQERVRAGPAVRDTWLALGQSVTEEEKLRVQRSWLWGERTGRPALLLSFAPPGKSLDRSVVVGTALDADLAFYDGIVPLRALLVQRHSSPVPIQAMPGHATIASGLGAWADAVARNPWLDRYFLSLTGVVPLLDGERWVVLDGEGRSVVLAVRPQQGWRLRAISGGRAIALAGEWDGTALVPLSAWDGDAIVCLD